jgi:hypothetical protein
LAKSKNGIEVYLRKTPESPIKEFKVEALINTPISRVVHALAAIHEHAEWMVGVDNARQIHNPSAPADSFLYYVIDLPFPISDRDIVMRKSSGYGNNGETFHIALSGHADLIPVCDDYIRMLFVKGSYHLTSEAHDSTQVVYTFVSDPGGSIPNWLVNAFIVNNPYKTMRNLRNRLESGE